MNKQYVIKYEYKKFIEFTTGTPSKEDMLVTLIIINMSKIFKFNKFQSFICNKGLILNQQYLNLKKYNSQIFVNYHFYRINPLLQIKD